MIIPYNTDAPIYYFPYATIGLIVVNVAVFFVTAQADPENVIPWTLEFGDGYHPLQWLTNNFLHADFMHVACNMFFLWGFGLVVEGKLGWWKFLVLYLVMGLIYGFFIQTIMLGAAEGCALGASGVIFSLMAISLVWAPKNEMSCFMWIIRPMLVDVSIVFFACAYLALQIAVATFTGFSMSSEVLHLSGAGVGAVFGIAFVKLDWVDCEGWDLYSVWRGTETHRLSAPREAKQEAPPPKTLGPVQIKLRTATIKQQLAAGETARAAGSYQEYRTAFPDWQLEEPDLLGLIAALHREQLWSESIRPMVDYLRQYSERSDKVRLKLAQILLAKENRPMKALQVLSKLDPQTLVADLRPTHQKLVAAARLQQEDADLEVADAEDW